MFFLDFHFLQVVTLVARNRSGSLTSERSETIALQTHLRELAAKGL